MLYFASRFLLLVVVLLLCVSMKSEIIASEDTFIEVEHSVNGYDFLPRSKYLIKFKDGKAEINIAESEKNVIQAETLEGFKNILSNNGLYRVKVTAKNGDKSTTSTAAIPSCELQKSGFKEDLILHLDDNRLLIGLAYSSPPMAISRPCDPSKLKSAVALQTRIKIADVTIAQVVPLQALGPKPVNMQNINFEEEVGADGMPPPPKTFTQRYWHLIIPAVVLLSTLTFGTEEKGGGEAKADKK